MIAWQAVFLEWTMGTAKTFLRRCVMSPRSLQETLPNPMRLPLLVDKVAIDKRIQLAVSDLEANALERIRSEIRNAFFDGLNTGRWSSRTEFGEIMFPDAVTPNAQRGLVDRLLNKSYTGFGSKVTRESIIQVGRRLGLPIDEWLYRDTAMDAKRATTAMVVLPEARVIWQSHFTETPELPTNSDGHLSGSFTILIAKVGMPPPHRYQTLKEFDTFIDSVKEWAPGATYAERFWTATWSLHRLFHEGFSVRLRHACHLAKGRNDRQGLELLHHINVNERVIRAVRKASGKLGWPGASPARVMELAEKELSRTPKLTLNGLKVFLRDHNATVHAICNREIGIGWFIWHNDAARSLAHSLLTS